MNIIIFPIGKEQDTLSRFKNWFWSILERMTQRERQDLLYFWTSSPVLPASVDSYQPAPSVTIRPPDDQRLPTANTCISRLYIPLYSTKAILKTRLLTAIKTKTFGFVWSMAIIVILLLVLIHFSHFDRLGTCTCRYLNWQVIFFFFPTFIFKFSFCTHSWIIVIL